MDRFVDRLFAELIDKLMKWKVNVIFFILQMHNRNRKRPLSLFD